MPRSTVYFTVAAVAATASLCAARAPAAAPESAFDSVKCEGVYNGHLQGICTDGKDRIFWSFTKTLVKTDQSGKIIKKVSVVKHHGDLCYRDGRLYVAVNLGKFNQPAGSADSWVYAYDAADLAELARHKTPEVVHGAGGIAHHNDRFIVVGGLPAGVCENYAYEYDLDFKFIKRRVIRGGYTFLGIQTAEYADGHWWFGCYGAPPEMLKVDESFEKAEKFQFNCSLGISALPNGDFLVGKGEILLGDSKNGEKYAGGAVLTRADAKNGLIFVKKSSELTKKGN